MKVHLTSLAVSLLGFGACMDAGEVAPELGDTEQTVTTTALKFSSCSNAGSCDITLVPSRTPGWMCFLAGLTGDLADGSADPAGALVEQRFGAWILHIYNPNNNSIGAMTTCVPVTGPITTAVYTKSSGLNTIVHGTATTRCFLSGIRNYNGLAFSNFESNVSVLQRGTTNDKLISGNFPSGASLQADVVCASIPLNMGDWAYGNGTASTVTGNITSNALGGVACGLTGIGGSFPNRDTNDGVLIEYGTLPPTWGWVLSPWKGGWAECVK